MATVVIMPKFEMAQETGTVIDWFKQEGDAVKKGEPILEIETDKVTMEVEAPAEGLLRAISAASGDVIPIGEPIAYIVRPDEVWEPPVKELTVNVDHSKNSEEVAKATPVARRMALEHNVALDAVPVVSEKGRITRADVHAYLEGHEAGIMSKPDGRIRAVPAARRLARKLGIELAAIEGSGPEGRIQSVDVQRESENRQESQLAAIRETAPAVRRIVPLNAMRRTIARRMRDSFRDIPQFTTGIDLDMSRALEVVNDLNNDEDESRVSLTAFLVKACAWSLGEHPRVNASFEQDQLIEWASINIGVAVAVEQGLLVPVIRAADQKGLKVIAAELSDLASRARSGRLSADDLQQGTFTISNLGMFGIDRFTAIINPPQAAILAIGRVQKRPIVNTHDELVVKPMCTLTMTADHQVIDGAVAARFLSGLGRVIEMPGLLLS